MDYKTVLKAGVKKEKRNIFKNEKILGFSLSHFLVLLVGITIISITGGLLNNMVGALAFALIVGSAIGWIGDRIPIWNNWLGGGMLLTFFFASGIATLRVVPDTVVSTLKTFNGSTGFLELYILILIAGSILSVNRKLLMKAFIGYIPTILAGIALSFLFAAIAGLIVGVKPMYAILNIAMPIMGGGNGAGAIPMSKIWGEATGTDPQIWYASAFAFLSLGNLVAVLSGAILNRMGKKYPKITGNGELMKLPDDMKDLKEEVLSKATVADYATGLCLALFLYTFAHFYGSKISFINNAGLGFSIHKFAFMVIFCALLNISGILPSNIRSGARAMQLFFTKYMSFPLMITVGIGTNLMDFISVLTVTNLVIVVAVILGAMLGTALMGLVFKFYPVESMITAGLCMANGGGSGDVQVLGASQRMELMSFAQISSRIGGAIMLIIASIVFGIFA